MMLEIKGLSIDFVRRNLILLSFGALSVNEMS